MEGLPKPLARVVQARERVLGAQAKAADARRDLRQAIRDAREAGYSLERIGEALGITRQRVSQLLEE